jgi:hypothetical protein
MNGIFGLACASGLGLCGLSLPKRGLITVALIPNITDRRVQGYLAHKNPPPWEHHRALGMVLL